MSEIKSTLDLVMERTGNLSLSVEELREQKITQIRRQLKGLVQQYLDQRIDVTKVSAALAAARADDGPEAERLFVCEVLARIDLAPPDQRLLTLGRETGGIDTSPIEEVIEGYQKRLFEEQRLRVRDLKDALVATHGIGGSAVIPNLARDPQWNIRQAELETDFGNRLETIKTTVATSI